MKKPRRRKPMPRPDALKLWSCYAFRRENAAEWQIVASSKKESVAKAAAEELLSPIVEWRAISRYMSRAEPGTVLLDASDRYDLGLADYAWDGLFNCWRAPGEPIAPPPGAPFADHLSVEFGQPSWGWIDLEIRAAQQSIRWRLSYVFDPFDDGFGPWLDAIVEGTDVRLMIDIEGSLAELHVVGTNLANVVFVGRSSYDDADQLVVEMRRRDFVSQFYNSLVAFWEGRELKKNWKQWLLGLNEEDAAEDYPPQLWQPWPIRSVKVERYLSEEP